MIIYGSTEVNYSVFTSSRKTNGKSIKSAPVLIVNSRIKYISSISGKMFVAKVRRSFVTYVRRTRAIILKKFPIL
jgi:hypothetical protein